MFGGIQNIDACFSPLNSNQPNIFESNVQLQQPILNFEKGTKEMEVETNKRLYYVGGVPCSFWNAYFLIQVFILLFHVMHCIGLPMQIKFSDHIFPLILNVDIHSKG
jgi:hypothetical protein